jgi:sugar/nucleoside kinase (ribokinase family)
MLTVFGSTALDTIRTPTKILKDVLGGAATFAGISASFFTDTGLIAVVGTDFPKKYHSILKKYLDLSGLVIQKGKTFRYDGSYDKTLSVRTTNKTELNVLGSFAPVVPEKYRKSEFVYLANNDPDQNTRIIKEFDKVKFSMCDTIEFWINTKRNSVIKMIGSVDAVVINDEEAKLLTKEHNLIKCAKKMMEWGAKYVIIKKGEHGSLLFFDDVIFPSVAFSLEDIVDPTGAGDSFAGAMI